MFIPKKIQATIITSGMAVRLSPVSGSNGFWIPDASGSEQHHTLMDTVLFSGDQLIIGAMNEEDHPECEASVDFFDCSTTPQLLIGKLVMTVSQRSSSGYDWIPRAAGYVAYLADFLYPPATLRLIRVPGPIAHTNTNF